MEYGKIGPSSMEDKPKSGIGLCITGKVFRRHGVAQAVYQIDLINRTAMVRDPYAWWCGRRGVVKLPPIPIIFIYGNCK